MRPCEDCGKPLPVGCSPLKRFCDASCRKRSHRVRGNVVGLPSAKHEPGPVERATRAKLAAAGAVDSLEGSTALVLAARLDLCKDTGSAISAMTRELRSLVADATSDAAVDSGGGDEVDDLKAHRAKRLHA